MATQSRISKAPRCSNHAPMSAVMKCESCSAYLCRLCTVLIKGVDSCTGCQAQCRRLTPEELGQAAIAQTAIRADAATRTLVPPPPPPPTKSLRDQVGPKAREALERSAASAQQSANNAPPAAAASSPGNAGGSADNRPQGQQPIGSKQPPYYCKNHPKLKATRGCNHCKEEFCGDCAKMIEGNPRCPDCGGQINALMAEDQGVPERTTVENLVDAISFPFKGSGLWMLFFGSILHFFVQHGGWKGKLIGFAYLYAYGMKICRSSATGRETPPDWPQLSDIDGVGYFVVSYILSRLPAILYVVVVIGMSLFSFYAPDAGDTGMDAQTTQSSTDDEYDSDATKALEETDVPPTVKEARARKKQADRVARKKRAEMAKQSQFLNLLPYYALVLLGNVYLPMALLASILYRSYGVLSPIFVFASIARAGAAYFAAVIAMSIGDVVNVIQGILDISLEGTVAGFIIVPLVGSLCYFYILMVTMRSLGTMYYFNQRKLGWF